MISLKKKNVRFLGNRFSILTDFKIKTHPKMFIYYSTLAQRYSPNVHVMWIA